MGRYRLNRPKWLIEVHTRKKATIMDFWDIENILLNELIADNSDNRDES